MKKISIIAILNILIDLHEYFDYLNKKIKIIFRFLNFDF